MTDLATTSKVCTKCGVEKPLSEFHRDRSAKDGHYSACKPCVIERTQAWQARMRKEMGEAAWREYVRQNVAKHRASGRSKDGLQREAWNDAFRRLREMYPDAWEALYREERYKRGLSV